MEATDAGGEDCAESAGVNADGVNAADMIEGLARRSERKLLDTVGAARLLWTIEVGGRIPIFENYGLALRPDGPLRPAQKSLAPMPAGATTPKPVTATRRSPAIRVCR